MNSRKLCIHTNKITSKILSSEEYLFGGAGILRTWDTYISHKEKLLHSHI
jgi:hypothetical protein